MPRRFISGIAFIAASSSRFMPSCSQTSGIRPHWLPSFRVAEVMPMVGATKMRSSCASRAGNLGQGVQAVAKTSKIVDTAAADAVDTAADAVVTAGIAAVRAAREAVKAVQRSVEAVGAAKRKTAKRKMA